MRKFFRNQETVVADDAELAPIEADTVADQEQLAESTGDEDYTQHAPIGTPEYFLEAPEVVKIAALMKKEAGIIAAMRGTTIDNINQKLEASPIERRLKRALINSGVATRASEAAQAMAQLFVEPESYPKGDVQARMNLYIRTSEPFRGKLPIIDEQAVYMDIYKAAANLEPKLQAYRLNSEALTKRFEADISQDPGSRYELVKLLSGRQPIEPEQQLAATWLLRLLNNPYESNGSLVKRLVKEIEAGGFAHMMAYEVLESEVKPLAVRHMLELVSLSGELDEDGLKRLAESSDRWPKEASAFLKDVQSELAEALRNACERARADLSIELGLVSDNLNGRERFEKSMQRLVAAVAGSPRLSIDRLPPTMRKRAAADMGRLAAAAKPVVPVPGGYRPQAEVIREVNNKLNFVDKQGSVSEQESVKFQEMVDDFLATYRGTKELPTDLEATLKYLCSVDFSRPVLSGGIEKIKSGDWMVETDKGIQARPLYRLKPFAASNLPLKTNVMRDHRILFTLIDNSTVGVVGIVNRRDLNIWLKKAGINTSAK